jgi:hypothetical protein
VWLLVICAAGSRVRVAGQFQSVTALRHPRVKKADIEAYRSMGLIAASDIIMTYD